MSTQHLVNNKLYFIKTRNLYFYFLIYNFYIYIDGMHVRRTHLKNKYFNNIVPLIS